MAGTAAEWDAQFGEWLLTQLYIAYRQARRGKRLVRFFEEAVYFGQNRPNYVDSVQSYLGHLKHFDSQRAVEKMFREMGWDYKY